MANEKYQVLTAPKTAGVSLKEAQQALAAQYPTYKVEVHEVGNEFVAKLARKTAASPKGKVPPFLDEDDSADDAPPSDDSSDDAAPDDSDDGSDDDVPKPPKDKKDSDDDGDDKSGGDDLSKAIKALDTLKSVLPKLETQLKTLNGGELPGGLGDGPLGPDGAPKPPGLDDGSAGPGGPSQADLDAVGPTPGKPTPGNAKPMIPGMGAKGPRPPMPNVGVPTFSNMKQNRFVNRPIRNEDGTEVSLVQASQEIASHPRYANYRVHEIKVDDTGEQYIAHLKLNN